MLVTIYQTAESVEWLRMQGSSIVMSAMLSDVTCAGYHQNCFDLTSVRLIYVTTIIGVSEMYTSLTPFISFHTGW